MNYKIRERRKAVFGYVNINQPEIRFKDFYRFRSYYCGMCRELKHRHGLFGRLSLGYDMTFLIVLLSGLYDCDTELESFRCFLHPLKKRNSRINQFTSYAADMNLLLTYFKCADDWDDEKKLTSRIYGKLIKRKAKKVMETYPEKAEIIERNLREQQQYEKTGEMDIDTVSGYFGRVLEEVFDYKKDIWSPYLRKLGFFLGKYVYIMDAYDDVVEDLENGCYNPLSLMYNKEGFDEKVRDMLGMMIAQTADAFEMLPIDENIEILRNIIYSGVWKRYEIIGIKRNSQQQDCSRCGTGQADE